jgi:hypothetical protein
MEKPIFTRMNLSDVRLIMMIMHVLMEELLCQVVTELILVLECLLLGARGCLWLHPVMTGIKWRCFLSTWLQGTYLALENPLAWLLGARVCAEPGHKDKADWVDK